MLRIELEVGMFGLRGVEGADVVITQTGERAGEVGDLEIDVVLGHQG